MHQRTQVGQGRQHLVFEGNLVDHHVNRLLNNRLLQSLQRNAR